MNRPLFLLLGLALGVASPALAGDVYDSIGRRDPFRGLLHTDPGVPITPTVHAVFAQYDLEELTLVAVAGDDGTRYALVEAPEGPGALLLEGSRLSRVAATVLSIDEDRLVVREERRLGDGTLLIHDHTLALAELGTRLPGRAPGP
ncbi:MAG: pilus assembly protein PilP [Proteobacteria bacterium]|nr:pilus assembly protein PilP [Pseudomonadota bacterium]